MFIEVFKAFFHPEFIINCWVTYLGNTQTHIDVLHVTRSKMSINYFNHYLLLVDIVFEIYDGSCEMVLMSYENIVIQDKPMVMKQKTAYY